MLDKAPLVRSVCLSVFLPASQSLDVMDCPKKLTLQHLLIETKRVIVLHKGAETSMFLKGSYYFLCMYYGDIAIAHHKHLAVLSWQPVSC